MVHSEVETLQRVALHVETAAKKPGCVCHTIPLNFVFGSERSLPMFMGRLPNLTPGGFQLCQLGDFFLLVQKSADMSDKNQDCADRMLPEPFEMCTDPEAEMAANNRPNFWLITQVKQETVKVYFQVWSPSNFKVSRQVMRKT